MEFTFENILFQESLVMPKKLESGKKTTYPGLSELEEKLNERLGIRFNENQLIIDGKTIAVIRYNGTGTRSFASITEKAADDDSIIIAISKKEDGLFNLWYETYTNIGANSQKSWSVNKDVVFEGSQKNINSKIIEKIIELYQKAW